MTEEPKPEIKEPDKPLDIGEVIHMPQNKARSWFRAVCQKYDLYYMPFIITALNLIFVALLAYGLYSMVNMKNEMMGYVDKYNAEHNCSRDWAFNMIDGKVMVRENNIDPLSNVSPEYTPLGGLNISYR